MITVGACEELLRDGVRVEFANSFHIAARDVLGMRNRARRLSAALIEAGTHYRDLPNNGRVFHHWTSEELTNHLDALEEMASVSGDSDVLRIMED